jgi:hypothetical protein
MPEPSVTTTPKLSPQARAVADEADSDNGFTAVSSAKKPSMASGNSLTQYLKHNTDFVFLVAYNGTQLFFKGWRGGNYLGNLTGQESSPMFMAAGTVPIGNVSMPFPSITSYNLTQGQRLVLGGMTMGTGLFDMATDLAENYYRISRYGIDGFEMALLGPTLDGISDFQLSRQMLSYSYVGDSDWKYMYTAYFGLRLLVDAELTQANQIGESPLSFWDGLTGQATSQSSEAIDECEWKDACGGKEVRMLDSPFAVADHIGNGTRGVDAAIAATGLQQTLLVNGKPTGMNLAAGVVVPILSLFLRHDEGDTWDFAGRDGGYFLRDLALQGGGFLLAYTTHDDPETQYRLTSVIPMLMMAAETPRAFEVLYNTEDAGKYDDMFYLGGNALYAFQNTMGGVATGNAIFDQDKSLPERIVPGAVALAGVVATTTYMGILDVKAREPQYRADSNPLNAMDPKIVGVVTFASGVGLGLLYRGLWVDVLHQSDIFGKDPQSDSAHPDEQAWHGQPTDLKFDLAPAMLPAATGGSTPGLQAGLSFRF